MSEQINNEIDDSFKHNYYIFKLVFLKLFSLKTYES